MFVTLDRTKKIERLWIECIAKFGGAKNMMIRCKNTINMKQLWAINKQTPFESSPELQLQTAPGF